jgi:hypothetical protein
LIQNNIQEWASPDFHSLAGLMLEGIILILIAGLLTRRVQVRTSEWILAVALLYLAFSSQRHVELFVLGAALLYGAAGQALLQTISELSTSVVQLRAGPSLTDGYRQRRLGSGAATPPRAAGPRRTKPLVGLMNLVLLVTVAGGMILYRALPNMQPAHEQEAIAASLPVDAAAGLAHLGRPARIFNYYDYGGYLIWTLYPKGDRVYIDGRVEVYGSAIFSDYLRVNYLGDGWQAVIDKAEPDAIILPTGHPLVQLLEADAKWQQFSRDRVATVLTRVGFAP